MPKIQILIYTDYDRINEKPTLYSWGITELKKFILYKTTNIAEYEIHYQYRFASKTNTQKLTADFLAQYHQVWVLAFETSTFAPFVLGADEVQALQQWMDKPWGLGGGLLVAGDHAAGLCEKGDPKTFSAHGRSLGEPMKRAGQLRVWEGPPTACVNKPLKDRDNFNTCEGNNPNSLDDSESQTDRLSVRLLDLPTPHSLFFLRKDPQGKDIWITRFPDHQHESKLIVPANLDTEWPHGSQPPVIAAKARDRRFPNEHRDYALVVAYDGDPKGVGRIVVDSSFHHYLNINLFGLRERDAVGNPKPDSDLDQIAQFYGNLALWLTPQAIRVNLKRDLFFRLATDPDVFEVRGSGAVNLGKVARFALDLRIGADDLHRILLFTESEAADKWLDHLFEAILLEQNAYVKLDSMEKTVILGSIVERYHNYLVEQDAPNADWLETKPEPLDMVSAGIYSAIKIAPALDKKLSPLL